MTKNTRIKTTQTKTMGLALIASTMLATSLAAPLAAQAGMLAALTGDDTLTMIDTRTSRVVGEPFELGVSPFSLAASDEGKTLWVGSQAENRLAQIATGRGG